MSDFSPFFRAHAHRLQQAALYWPRPNPGWGNPPWSAAGLKLMIIRLSSFRDVDRSTPHLFLADAARRGASEAFVDFAFFPPPRDRQLLRAYGVPLLSGIVSGRTAEDFDWVLISNAYTLELINLPFLLLHSGIPPLATDRAGRWPPFVLGGANAMAAQALVGARAESFVEAIFFGEGEGQVEKLVRGFGKHAPLLRDAAAGAPAVAPGPGTASAAAPRFVAARKRLLALARDIPGLWITGRWPERPLRKAIWTQRGVKRVPMAYPALNGPEAGTGRLQISRGCPAFCAFCFEGYDRKPYREVAAADLLAQARALKRTQGCDTLELTSFNFNTHSEILSLLPEMNRLFDRVRCMSQRADLLQELPELLGAELTADKRSYTLGLEGVSARLRAFLHKSLDTAALQALLARLLREKVRELKLFFLLTGHETAADESEFAGFCRQVQALRRENNPGLRVLFSFGLLVRMPFTPLRYDRLRLEPAGWESLIRAARGAVESAGFEFRLATPWTDYAATQILALAPYGLAEPLEALARAGFCYDQTLDPEYVRRLRVWMTEHGLWTETWLGEKPATYPFAFAFVQSNVPPAFLFRQYQAARAGRDDGYCLGRSAAPGRCRACGACHTTAERRRLTAHRWRRPADPAWLEKFAALMDAKARPPTLYGRFWLAPELAGADSAWLNARVLRALLAALPKQTDNLRAARESLFTVGANSARFPIFSGETVFALKAWDAAPLRAALGGLPAVASLCSGASPAHRRRTAADPTLSPEIRWLGGVEPFEPGVFRSRPLELRLPAEFFPRADAVFQRWLLARHVPFSLRRTPRGYRLDLAKPRPSGLAAAEVIAMPAEFIAHLTVGPKFDLGDLLAAWGVDGLFREATVIFGGENDA
ncbi:MAG: hypothetical protein NTV49_10645 [Kiritimatiellaeota bacterium]|nr:hypothetical protein [Kiritimatiellota bacterium]